MLLACDTAFVAFHEGFWVATSAVAPVIALAAVLALPDVTLIGRANVLLTRIQQRQPSDLYSGLHRVLLDAARNTVKWAWIAWLITPVNLIIQAGLLVVSLCALAFKEDIMPFWLAIFLATGGIALLALSTIVSAAQRWTLEHGLFQKEGVADRYLATDNSADGGTADGGERQ